MSIKDDFAREGVVVLPALVHRTVVQEWQAAWAAYYSTERMLNRFNPVEVKGPFGEVLNGIPLHPAIRRSVKEVLQDWLHVYNFRFVVKDARSAAPVFLHQDCGYHVGSATKLSAFVALSDVTPENGGMRFWLGTHKYGYLGDVGEIDRKHTESHRSICPVLAPGDVVLMHSALWHESGPNVSGPNRVLADIIYQRGDDVSRLLPRDGIFVRSRSSRLRELQAIVDAKR